LLKVGSFGAAGEQGSMEDVVEELPPNRQAGYSDRAFQARPESCLSVAYPASASAPSSQPPDPHKCDDPKQTGQEIAEQNCSRPASVLSDESTRCSKHAHMVWLHVYDIDAITARLNESLLKNINLGAFHCGVEVLGDEWFFAWGETDYTGVTWNEPRTHQVHVYRESICLGETPYNDEEIRHVLADAMDEWIQSSYHPITRNCVSFAEDLIDRLKVTEPFPAWVRGALDLGKTALLFPIADWGWRWIKWYCSEPPSEPIRHPIGPTHAQDGVIWPWTRCCREAP